MNGDCLEFYNRIPTDDYLRDNTRCELRPWIMLVGLNWGGGVNILADLLDAHPWSNFHGDPRSPKVPHHAKLYELSRLVPEMQGAYLTDVYKLAPSCDGAALKEDLSRDRGEHGSAMTKFSAHIFRQELAFCKKAAREAGEPLRIIAVGRHAESLLTNPGRDWPSDFRDMVEKSRRRTDPPVAYLTHYSAGNSKNNRAANGEPKTLGLTVAEWKDRRRQMRDNLGLPSDE